MAKTRVNGSLIIYHHMLAPYAAMLMEHVNAFGQFSRFKTWAVNTEFGFPRELEAFEFEVVILHYSLFGWFPFALDDAFRHYLADSGASYKVAFFQDEYRFWAARAAVLNECKVDCVYTCLEPAYYQETYGKYTRVPRLETYIPGYVSDEMVAMARRVNKPMAERTIDVGYRGRQAYHYMGRSAREKHEIGVKFRERAMGLGLRLDIETDEAQRIYGEAWLAFLGNCRAVLGVEAGVSIFDIDDVVVPACERLLHDEPDLSFDQVYERLLQPYDGTGVYYRTVSPRVFEAAAAGACQILYEGKYSGVVEPGVHYLPLRKDFANFDEIIRLYRDEGVRREIVQRAERDLIASGTYSYRRFIERFDAGLEAAGLEATISEATVQRVSDILRENERVLWLQKLHAKQAEYDQLLHQHIALQGQYMEQAKVLAQQNLDSVAEYDQLLHQHIALQEQYRDQATLLGQLQYREQAGLLGQSNPATLHASLVLVKVYLAQRLTPYPRLYRLGRWVLQAVRTLERQR